jgi:hypothetical protein
METQMHNIAKLKTKETETTKNDIKVGLSNYLEENLDKNTG